MKPIAIKTMQRVTAIALAGLFPAAARSEPERAGPPIVLRNCPNIAAPAGHYSHVAIANGFAFLAGQLPVRAEGTQSLVGASFDAQTRQVLSNLTCSLKAAKLGTDRLVMVTAYIVGVDNWAAFDRIYAEVVGENRPARAIVPVPELHHGYLVEVTAIAATAPESPAIAPAASAREHGESK